MNILHITGANGWGGNEQQLLDSCIELNKLNVTNFIYCNSNSIIEKKAHENNILVISPPASKAFSIKKIIHLKKQINKHEIDLIHLHTSDSVTTYVVTDILLNLNTPAVFSKKGISRTPKKGLSAFKYNYKNIKQVICVSKAVLESFKRTIKSNKHDKLTVIYDGINTNRITTVGVNIREKYNINNDTLIIGNIANHTRAKDLVTLVETANHLVNTLKFKNVIFFQVGKKSKYSEEFIPLISKYNLQSYFILTGFLENASGYISQFDAYVMSSEREGLPITIYEAFYKKTPVISTRAGGIPEAITNNKNGKLNDLKDYKGLANSIQEVLNSKELTSKFTSNSYEILLDKFTSIQLATETLSVYNKILKIN